MDITISLLGSLECDSEHRLRTSLNLIECECSWLLYVQTSYSVEQLISVMVCIHFKVYIYTLS